jgi:phage/plasmid-like protein (TIGR03299 family)
MADNIATDIRTGQKMVFTANTPAWWDTLGVCVRQAQTWEQVLQTARLDWEVIKAPLYTQWTKAGLLKVDSHVAIVRQDTKQHLGIVGKGYEPSQNRELMAWTEALLETGAIYESAGGLGQGERIWLLARMPKADFVVGNSDQHQSYLLVTSSHDGSLATTIKQTDTRVVCQNTLTMALQDGKQALKIKHTKSSKDRLEQAKRMMSASIQTAASLKEKFDLLASRRITKDQLTTVLDRLFPIDVDAASQATKTRRDNVLADVLSLFERNDGNAFPEQRGTAYALLNAVTNYVDHSRTTRIAAGNTQTTIQSRTESSIWGSGAQMKDTALATIEQVCTGDAESDAMWNAFYTTPPAADSE